MAQFVHKICYSNGQCKVYVPSLLYDGSTVCISLVYSHRPVSAVGNIFSHRASTVFVLSTGLTYCLPRSKLVVVLRWHVVETGLRTVADHLLALP